MVYVCGAYAFMFLSEGNGGAMVVDSQGKRACLPRHMKLWSFGSFGRLRAGTEGS